MMQSTGERWVHGVSVVYQADDAARNVQNGGIVWERVMPTTFSARLVIYTYF